MHLFGLSASAAFVSSLREASPGFVASRVLDPRYRFTTSQRPTAGFPPGGVASEMCEWEENLSPCALQHRWADWWGLGNGGIASCFPVCLIPFQSSGLASFLSFFLPVSSFDTQTHTRTVSVLFYPLGLFLKFSGAPWSCRHRCWCWRPRGTRSDSARLRIADCQAHVRWGRRAARCTTAPSGERGEVRANGRKSGHMANRRVEGESRGKGDDCFMLCTWWGRIFHLQVFHVT